MFRRYWGVDIPENWRAGLARAGSMREERQVVKGGGSVLNGSGVQFRNSPWKIQQAGLLSGTTGGERRKVRGAGRRIGDCSNLFAVLVYEVSTVNNMAEGSQ